MKKYRALLTTLLGAIALLWLLVGCDTAQTQQPFNPVAASDSISLPPDDTATQGISSDNPFIVKGINGADYDLSLTAWGIKYPFMVDYYRELEEAIQANGGNAIMYADAFTNWSKTTLPDSCVTDFGSPVISYLGFDREGNFDQNGPQLTTTIRSAVLDETTTLAPELLELRLEKADGQGYLTVELTIENTGNEETKFTLNSIRPYVFVDKELAVANTSISEMISASSTEENTGDSSFFHCTLAPGQSQDYTVVFYADQRIELGDIYLGINYPGLYVESTPTENPMIFTMTGIFCALK